MVRCTILGQLCGTGILSSSSEIALRVLSQTKETVDRGGGEAAFVPPLLGAELKQTTEAYRLIFSKAICSLQ